MKATFYTVSCQDGIEGEIAVETLREARALRASQDEMYGEIARVTVDLPARQFAVRIFNRDRWAETSVVVAAEKSGRRVPATTQTPDAVEGDY